jgi:hypothetical protein
MVRLEIEPEDFNNFVDMVENSLAHLNDIAIKAETDKQIAEAWKEKLPQAKQYTTDLLKELYK